LFRKDHGEDQDLSILRNERDDFIHGNARLFSGELRHGMMLAWRRLVKFISAQCGQEGMAHQISQRLPHPASRFCQLGARSWCQVFPTACPAYFQTAVRHQGTTSQFCMDFTTFTFVIGRAMIRRAHYYSHLPVFLVVRFSTLTLPGQETS